MKIGILTLTLNTNYGGILQAYAFQTVLERMGHEVMVIDKDRDIRRNKFRLSLSWCKYCVKKYVLGRDVTFFNPKKINSERHEREQYTKKFIDQYIHTYTVSNLVKEFPSDMDAIVVGSDQVWRPSYFKDQWKVGIENAFLEFAEGQNLKRITYAVSFGTDDWEYSEKETAKCAQLLKDFDAVSVREVSGKRLCKEKLNRNDALQVLDPTLLLSKKDYVTLINKANIQTSKGTLMCYILDMSEEKKVLIERIADERKLSPFYTNSRVEDPTASNAERIQPPVEQWLRSFMDAEFVVTDSFHACVFSIIFGKPFIAIANKNRGVSRFYSLLDMLSLRKNLIVSTDEYNPSIDYSISNETYEKLEQKREQSREFLIKALS